jgi:PAS domain S-box-containing protein
MFTGTVTVHSVLLGGAAVATAALCAFAARRRSLPGATPFAVLMACLSAWSLTYGLGLHVAVLDPRLLLLRLQWTAVPFITVALLLFAAAYTGADWVLTRRAVAAIAAIPVVTVVAAWTNHWHQLLWTAYDIHTTAGMHVLAPSFGPLFWVYTIYSYALVAVSMALMLRLVFRSQYLYVDQSVLVLLGIAAPFVANVVDVFVDTGGPPIDYTPVAFTVTGLAFGYALFRRRLFEYVPATRKLGRSSAIDQLGSGVVIVDTNRRVVYANDAASDVIGCEPKASLGERFRDLVDDDAIDFTAANALAELSQGEQTYEIRLSEITDAQGTSLGYTLVIHDVTARNRRIRELATQRDELATLNELNGVIRGVNEALVAAASREGIATAVCERITDAALYETACMADVPTWTGNADDWTTAGASEATPPVSSLDAEGLQSTTARNGSADIAGGGEGNSGGEASDDDERDCGVGDGWGDDESTVLAPVTADESRAGVWTVVPLVYRRTVYGALGLYTERDAISAREREILGELGETIGQAINAVETRRLLSAESVVELGLASGPEDVLRSVTAAGDWTLELAGLVPGGTAGPVAYLRVVEGAPDTVRDALADATAGRVRVLRSSTDGGVLEWTITGDAFLGALVEHSATVTDVRADSGDVRYEVQVAADDAARTLVDALSAEFPGVTVCRKRAATRSIDAAEALPERQLTELTDRQREALEAAYRSGYFNWPRDSNAEEVAETLGITSATLHSHLRKAEATLFKDIFDPEDDDRPQ